MPKDTPSTLIMVPTYDEADNAPAMVKRIFDLGLDADLLFVDDNSPDGTGAVIGELQKTYPRLQLLTREKKSGIGGAHLTGIQRAYDSGYRYLVTLDCDFSHSPADIPRLLAELENAPVAVGSRFMREDSLEEWNRFRKSLTHLGHRLTQTLLKMPQDATGAFRAYDLERVPRDVWSMVASRGYSFFFESLFLLVRNGMEIREIPIALPARTYGHSKMSPLEAVSSAARVLKLWYRCLTRPEQFSIDRSEPRIDEQLQDPQDWDSYWRRKESIEVSTYDFIATLYRNLIMGPFFERVIRHSFPRGAKLLHAGCGSGQLDARLGDGYELHALDISREALSRYARNNPFVAEAHHASIFALPFEQDAFDGVFNLGVMEHFSAEEIDQVLGEVRRVLRPGGKFVCFWPHQYASSAIVLDAAHFVLNDVLAAKVQLHPEEVSRLKSENWAREVLASAGFELSSYEFGLRDFGVQAVLEAVKAG